MSADDYRPPFWYRGRHLQTLWGPLFRHWRRPPVRRERLETPDGDFLDLDWVEGASGDAPLVLILHGLEGSSRSHYARGLLLGAKRLGWRGAVLHFRSCSGEVNRLARLYHSGETTDLEWVVGHLRERDGATRIGVVGISLGGNVALKWLGERGEAAEVAAAVAISTPFDLAACATVLDRGFNRAVYTTSFLRTMKAKIRMKRHLYDGEIDLSAVLGSRTFREYDRFFTAPLNGFADERDYWTRASSGPYLDGIRRPTLLISAVNDPFMPSESLPRAAVERSPWLEAAFVAQGGHVGFLDGPLGASSWAERRALAFLRRHLLR
ncbi:MAG TPA: alpha/beta fold hydrolase [Candidatus Nitrosotalea sp.]|jgi:predicted alpha/beta-fold hydrolase|nr:alpha/beta fold hydrolase [Candidatus Nitrosotalea sp.]